ncbi:MAG TPA: DMT family transporter [Kiritimatiellia bacterium]|nr:DMT family transporter [Kiritimatiellia bacterium]
MNQAPYLYRQSIRRGAMFLLCSSLVFSFVGAMVKSLTSELPVAMVVFFRNGAGLIFLLPWILLNKKHTLKTTHLVDHAARAVSGVLAMYFFFHAIANMPLSEAISLNFTSPLIIPVMAYIVLRETIPARMSVLLCLGFAGVLLIVKPGAGVFNPAALSGVASAFFAAFALVNIRKLTRTEPAMRVVFYFALIGSLITLPAMLIVWQNPTSIQWVLLVGVGLFATVGQWLLTRGYASGPVGQVGIFHYSAVVFAGMIDWIIWSDAPDVWSMAGVLLICAAGVIAMRISRVKVI